MVTHYVLQPELRHNMDYLAEIYLHYQTIHIEELDRAKRQRAEKYARPLPSRRFICTPAEDADVTLKIKNILEQELKKNDAEKFY